MKIGSIALSRTLVVFPAVLLVVASRPEATLASCPTAVPAAYRPSERFGLSFRARDAGRPPPAPDSTTGQLHSSRLQAGAQPTPAGTVSSSDVAEVARELNCPVCQGYNLQDCPLPVCAQMRELIRERLAAGETKDDILAAFVQDYGPQVLNAPPREGAFLAAWLLPIVVLLMGVAAAVVWLKRGSTQELPRLDDGAEDTSTAGIESKNAYAQELERLARDDAEPERR